MSGQYAHNHATINNSLSGGCYGSEWREHAEPRTIPVLLQQQGYHTFYAGKYLNKVIKIIIMQVQEAEISITMCIDFFCSMNLRRYQKDTLNGTACMAIQNITIIH